MDKEFDKIVNKVYNKPEYSYEYIEGEVICDNCYFTENDYDGYIVCPECGNKLVHTDDVQPLDFDKE